MSFLYRDVPVLFTELMLTFFLNLGALSLTSVTVMFKGTEVVREFGATSLATICKVISGLDSRSKKSALTTVTVPSIGSIAKEGLLIS